MPTYTTNYNLKKPSGSEYFNLTTDLNNNFDAIDAQLFINSKLLTSSGANVINTTGAGHIVDFKVNSTLMGYVAADGTVYMGSYPAMFNYGGATGFAAGTNGSRALASGANAGSVYISTDLRKMYFSNGIDWFSIGGASRQSCVDSGDWASAEGYATTASGSYSHSQNSNTIAQGLCQTAIGMYNVAQGSPTSSMPSDYAFVIGNGSSDLTRSNAFAVTWDGQLVVASNANVTNLNADKLDDREGTAYVWNGSEPSTNMNTITQSGVYRMSGSDTNGPGVSWGQLFVMHGAGDTITQIYGDYNSGTLHTRSGAPTDVGGAGSWTAWHKLWSSGNDGSGSLLDADKLDAMEPTSADTVSTIVSRDASGNFSGKTITATTKFLAPNGTAAAPTISFTNDPNSGIYTNGSDTLYITTAGTNSAYFDPDGDTTIVKGLTVGGAMSPTLGPIATLGTLTSGGTGMMNGTHTNVLLSGSATGLYGLATVTVASNVVTAVTLTWGGNRYAVGDVLYGTPSTTLTTTGGSITGTTATLTFAAQAAAPFAVGGRITVTAVVASAAVPTTCYQITNGTVTACTTTSVSYTITAPTGTTTITTQGSIVAGTPLTNFNIPVATISPTTIYVTQANAPSRIRLENTLTGTSAGTEYGAIYFAGRDGSVQGSGDLVRIIGKAAGTSGGGYLEFHTAANGGATALSLTVNSTTATFAGAVNIAGATKAAGNFYTGTSAASNVNRLNYDGYLYATRVYNAVYNDYAEYFEKDMTEEFEAGDVICKKPDSDRYCKSRMPFDTSVVGVYSDSYGLCVGGDGDGNDDDNYIPIGLCGRVNVKVIGRVEQGDMLVTSFREGVAMSCGKQYKPGTVIGKALESYDGNDIGKVRMLIMNC